jgi:hypothetical protein
LARGVRIDEKLAGSTSRVPRRSCFEAHRPFHAEVKPRAGQKPMSEVKMLKSDPAQVQAQSEEIKAHYAKVFRV